VVPGLDLSEALVDGDEKEGVKWKKGFNTPSQSSTSIQIGVSGKRRTSKHQRLSPFTSFGGGWQKPLSEILILRVPSIKPMTDYVSLPKDTAIF